MRTNASLFYAERFTPVREAVAVDLAMANELGGKIHCYPGSWVPKIPELANTKIPAHWQRKEFVADKVAHFSVDLALLRLSEVKRHDSLTPIYGHQLNFKLAQGNNG